MTAHPRGSRASHARIGAVRTHAYAIPTDAPEGDGTLTWDSTTLVLVEVDAAGHTGIGYSYTGLSAATLIRGTLAGLVTGMNALAPQGVSAHLQQQIRNLGRDGIAATAISAIDTAVWDLKARIIGLPLATLFGLLRQEIEIYGSGGFTTYSDARLREQFTHYREQDGCRHAKMKIGADPNRDPHCIEVARDAFGDGGLMVDANGALGVKPAVALAQDCLREAGVCWFEEPVSSDDLEGLSRVRSNVPGKIEVAAGEYGYDLDYFRRMLRAGAVDVLQADATRCGGYTSFLQVAALCDAHHIDLSAHCAPALHVPVACAATRMRHIEWFHDHVRIEHMLFEGAPRASNGQASPNLDQPGHGLAFKFQDAERYRVA